MSFARPLADSTVPARPRLSMPDQRLDCNFRDPAAPGVALTRRTLPARLFVLGVPLAISFSLGWISLAWFRLDKQVSPAELALVAATMLAYFWVVLSCATAVLGLFWRATPLPQGGDALNIAILLPMYGEPAEATIPPATALLARLRGNPQGHRFSLHVLSDTRDPESIRAEQSTVAALRRSHPHLVLHYRHRPENIDYKSGNIRDWVEGHGADHDAMLILDADSRMGPEAVLYLAQTLATDPACGLVQSVARVRPGDSLWQGMQSFASQVYGVTLARGFAVWTGSEGNFLGHNALIRTAAFAASAGLPHLPGRRPLGGVILSHDFVEAALMRRAGWGVRVVPEAAASYEDTPETLPGYIRRDRRWCQGNMQHLRLLAIPGLHLMSRLHLLQGAMAYLASVWWLCLLLLWATLGEGGPIRYFTDANPAMPVWPVLPPVTQGALAGLVLAMLLAPKLIGIAAHLREHGLPRGQRGRFAGSVGVEVVLSILMAPMLMVHQVRAVLRTAAGFDGGWVPHLAGRPDLVTLLRFHATETLLGAGMIGLVVAGGLTVWLLPVAVCLALAVPLSALVACDARHWPLYRIDVLA